MGVDCKAVAQRLPILDRVEISIIEEARPSWLSFLNGQHDFIKRVLPDGPERLALFDRAKKMAVAYAPYKLHCHRYVADMMHPMVVGYRRPLFWNEWWHMVDADPALRTSAAL